MEYRPRPDELEVAIEITKMKVLVSKNWKNFVPQRGSSNPWRVKREDIHPRETAFSSTADSTWLT